MNKSETTFIAIGGGEFSETEDVLSIFLEIVNTNRDPHITIMTVATAEPESASSKYNAMFRKNGIKHVHTANISERGDSFDEAKLKKIETADAVFFTGGDQLNVTTLLGGSPIHNLMHKKIKQRTIIAGTSAGAAMMSNMMIVSGKSDNAPQVGGVEIAPGLNLVKDSIIDTHFSQRGRHGRLLTAVAHYPQSLGIGLDERTAIVVSGDEFKVVGDGAVTIIDGSQMKHSNLPFLKKNEPIGLFGIKLDILPAGYRYDLEKREATAPDLNEMAVKSEVN